MRKFPVWGLAVAAAILIGSSSAPEAAETDERFESCTLAPFEWNLVGSFLTREGRWVRVDYLAIATASHSGPDCPLNGESVVIRDRAYVLFLPYCGPDGTTPLRGSDPLDYGTAPRMEFRGPITGTVTCGEGGLRRLDMEIQAKTDKGSRLTLNQTAEVDLAGKGLTSLNVIAGELVLR